MDKQLKRLLLFIAAFVFLFLGVLGLALPFLQGLLFLAIGLILLSVTSPAARSWIEWHTKKYPRAHAFVEKTEAWIVRIIGPL